MRIVGSKQQKEKKNLAHAAKQTSLLIAVVFSVNYVMQIKFNLEIFQPIR